MSIAPTSQTPVPLRLARYPKIVIRTLCPRALVIPLLLVALAVPASVVAGTDTSDAPAVMAYAGYSGQWTPDHAADAKIAKQLRKKMRARLAKLQPPEKPPAGGPGGGMPGGMPVERTPGGGMSGRGAGEAPPVMPDMPTPTAVGLLRPEMDFAAPLDGDLFIVQDEAMIAMGKDANNPVILPYGRGAVDLGDDGLTALAMQSSDGLVVEFHTSDGATVSHTYSLEASGTQLRVRTHVSGGRIPIPGGLDFERLYNRVQTAAAP